MGGWVLEIAKMSLYMAFPVCMFHYFNQPEYFEKWVTSTRRELYPPDNTPEAIRLQNFIKEMNQKHDEELVKQLQELEKKSALN